MRSYILAGRYRTLRRRHLGAGSRGLNVVPPSPAGLDARPAVETYLHGADGRATVDAVVSLTGFSLVGGPAFNDSAAAEDAGRWTCPTSPPRRSSFRAREWRASSRGLMPVESTIMLAIPEWTAPPAPTVFGGRSSGDGHCHGWAVKCEIDPIRSAPDPWDRVDRLANSDRPG
jgi:magnesium chelatase subunit H